MAPDQTGRFEWQGRAVSIIVREALELKFSGAPQYVLHRTRIGPSIRVSGTAILLVEQNVRDAYLGGAHDRPAPALRPSSPQAALPAVSARAVRSIQSGTSARWYGCSASSI